MYALAITKRAGRYGEERDDEIDAPPVLQPSSPLRPINLGLETARYTSRGDLQPTGGRRRRSLGGDRNNNHQATTNTVQKDPDPLTQELLRMHEQQELEQQLCQMQLQQQHDMYGGLLPNPGPPPTTVYCLRSRTNSTVSDISFKKCEWVDNPSMASSKSAHEHMVLAKDWEGVILHATVQHNRENSLENSGGGRNSRVTPCSRSPKRSNAMSGPEMTDDLSPLVLPTRKATVVTQEFTVWNPHAAIPTVLRDWHESQPVLARKPSAMEDDQKHSNDSDNQRSLYCSMEETNQTYQQLHVYGAAALPKQNNETTPSKPPLRMDELRIEGLTEDEMICLAIKQSLQEEEVRQRPTAACVVEEDIAVKPLQGYSLEKVMEMPRPVRTPKHSVPKVRNMLGRQAT
jgi:hypothetical protein